MSYMALYRKFRPVDFEDVRGQEPIVTTLKNQIRADRVGHAYLFCGTRGTGKTTIAKIFAKGVNCKNPINGNPCNQCAMCRSISNQTSMNVIEMDAASNNGVDNIRGIVDEVQYSPAEGKYKVYIIDEVHMLSTGAFNALLKTLEEPPAYVIFILATTEAHKIPITILSRCQRYDFRRMTIDVISNRLKELIEKEGIQAEEKAIRYIAKAADGSMRDGLSILDQCTAFYFGKELTYDRVLDVLGTVDIEVFSNLFCQLLKGNILACIELLEEMVADGKEMGQFVLDFTWHLRNMLLVKTSDQSYEMVDVSSENLKLLEKDSREVEIDTLMRFIRIFSELSNQVKYASQKRVLVEIAFIKMCRPSMEVNYDSLLERLRVIEKKLEREIPEKIVYTDRKENTVTEKEEKKKDDCSELAVTEDIKEVVKNWEKIKKNMPTVIREMLTGVKLSTQEGNILLLIFENKMQREFIKKEEHLQQVTDAIQKSICKEVMVQTKQFGTRGEQEEKFLDLSGIFNMPVEIE